MICWARDEKTAVRREDKELRIVQHTDRKVPNCAPSVNATSGGEILSKMCFLDWFVYYGIPIPPLFFCESPGTCSSSDSEVLQHPALNKGLGILMEN